MASDILGIQILGFLFGIFMAYYTFLHYKRKEITIKEYSFWVGLWVVFITLTLFPAILKPFLKQIGFARALDFFIVAGFMFLIGSMFYIYLLVRGNQKKIENIVRKIALEKK
ncbi:MAG: DUF2304 domain-containing protein [Nanoarchaeota archaeon]|nr:DUF2304 domain-containing protein [Nanoarchaeota archaeon]MBU1005141.1 DUF2304 domain-containing protein [Nanoarchaeota archaeon]MBU1946010.1 DUF2304 domain-containing protein [Nanoarchaeota archaeon]